MAEIKIPEGVNVSIDSGVVITKGSLGTNKRKINSTLLEVSKTDDKIIIIPIKSKILGAKAAMSENSFAKELMNDMKGVTKHFEITMQTTHSHFPLVLEVKGDSLLIKNMIGERAPRSAKIAGGTKVEVKGQNVRVYGTSLDDVSQTAANIRKACKIVKKDERVFQDGVYYALEE
jgi:large subunit ribosomal protein L6